MKIISLTGMMLSMLLASSCLTSLQPLVTYNTIIEDNRLTGSWQHENDHFDVKKLMESELGADIAGSVKTGNASDRKPLTGKDKQDSIFYSHSYLITFEKNGIKHYMAGSLMRISNEMYLQTFPLVIDDPSRPDGSGMDYSFDYTPGFCFAKIIIGNGNSLQLQFPDGNFIKEQVRAGNMRIKHEKNELFQTFLVTASTRDLRSFFEKYGHDERLFNKQNSVTLTRQ